MKWGRGERTHNLQLHIKDKKSEPKKINRNYEDSMSPSGPELMVNGIFILINHLPQEITDQK